MTSAKVNAYMTIKIIKQENRLYTGISDDNVKFVLKFLE